MRWCQAKDGISAIRHRDDITADDLKLKKDKNGYRFE